ncbi:MAG: efflux RND transporter periplasmic adaptor subunit [Desulfobacteraceae bacterium]|nr:efflux RND transporter periplasmic adaptor subunit [Desulfobacteraceae bacterium]
MSQTNIHAHIIENIDDGIITVSHDGTIVDFNPAASRLLGISHKKALHHSLGPLLLEDERNDAFAQAIFDAVYEANVTHNRIVRYYRGQDAVSLAINTSFLKDARGEKQGVIAVFRDISEIEHLREAEQRLNKELKANNRKLSKAYLELEKGNTTLQAALKKVRVIRIVVTLFVTLLLLGGGAFIWWPGNSWEVPGLTPKGNVVSEGKISVIPVVIQPFRSMIKLTGVIQPLEVVNVVSPLSGHVHDKQFRYGQRVERGQTLFSIGTEDTAVQYRDAQVAYINAVEALHKIENWEKGTEVAKARRSLTCTRLNLESLRQETAETRRLVDMGIVAASEHQSLQDRLTMTSLEYQAAQEDLDNVLAQGGADAHTTARLKLENAEYKMKELEEKLRLAEVIAPVSGVVLLPPDSEEQVHLEVGSTVQEGASALSIGNLEGISVNVQVDEIMIGKIQEEHPVRISGEAFPETVLKGEVVQVSSQASLKNNRSSVPTFEIIVQASSLTVEQQRQIRVGMSSTLEILVYDNPEALMVPLEAVRTDGSEHYLLVQDKGAELLRRVPVEIGLTDLNSVEIISGLQPGAKVVIGAPGPGLRP